MSPPPLYPLRFEPIYKTALWGGRRLADRFETAPADGPIAEAWVVSDVDDNLSVVADGALQGTALRHLMRTRCGELLGLRLSHHETFPLLLKVIDTDQPLSVQVHPNDEQAQRLENQPRGKTEAWYVLHAEPGSRIYAGFQEGVERSSFVRALESGQFEGCLHSFEPKVGDCVFIPAGTVHAAGPGLTVFEVQQTSDLTYRLHDWGRVDAKTGQPRTLHVEKALECLDFARGPVEPIRLQAGDSSGKLVQCNYFELVRVVSQRETVMQFDECRIMIGITGSALCEWPATRDGAALSPGRAVLVPPGTCVLRPHREVEWLLCRPN
jgi:mannose-6-phosphate isomerase